MSVPITITSAGLAALINAHATGTAAITIAAIGVSATAITPDAAMTTLSGELYRITAISGSVVSPDTIHVVMQDTTTHAYSALSFGLYLTDGTLFAIYGQSTPIYVKTAASIGLLAIDVTFAAALASSITFGNANFINPPATTTTMGVVQLATLAQAQAGTEAAAVLTPAMAAASVLGWIEARDGTGSLLDADLLDGHDSGFFARASDLAAYVTLDYLTANIQALVAGVIAAVATAAGFSYYFGVNGYVRLPTWLGGAIWQWGKTAAFYGEGDQAISFPIAFPTACYNAQATQILTSAGNTSNDQGAKVYNPGTTGMTVNMQIYGGGSSSFPCYAYWLVWGK